VDDAPVFTVLPVNRLPVTDSPALDVLLAVAPDVCEDDPLPVPKTPLILVEPVVALDDDVVAADAEVKMEHRAIAIRVFTCISFG
jgi:hypothetical protein